MSSLGVISNSVKFGGEPLVLCSDLGRSEDIHLDLLSWFLPLDAFIPYQWLSEDGRGSILNDWKFVLLVNEPFAEKAGFITYWVLLLEFRLSGGFSPTISCNKGYNYTLHCSSLVFSWECLNWVPYVYKAMNERFAYLVCVQMKWEHRVVSWQRLLFCLLTDFEDKLITDCCTPTICWFKYFGCCVKASIY